MAGVLKENRTPDFTDTASSSSATLPVDTAGAPGLDFGPSKSAVPPLNSGTSSNSVLRHTHRWLRFGPEIFLVRRLQGAFTRGADAALSFKEGLIQCVEALCHKLSAETSMQCQESSAHVECHYVCSLLHLSVLAQSGKVF